MGCNEKDRAARVFAAALVTAASLDPEAGHEFLQQFVAGRQGFEDQLLQEAVEVVRQKFQVRVTT